MVCVDCAHIKKVHCKLSQNNILPFKNFNVFLFYFLYSRQTLYCKQTFSAVFLNRS